MKILQICLCGSYNPQMEYQDNILPKYYVKLEFECVTVTSQYYKEKGNIVSDKNYKIRLKNGSALIRIPNKYKLPYKGNSFLRLFFGLHEVLVKENPDIIFLHNFQFLSIYDVIRYCKKNKNVKVFVDSHTDYVNSARNWISLNILHKVIWRHCVKGIEPYVTKFWGVTEQRCKFLNEVYKVPEDKIDLLVMGADDDKINSAKKDVIRSKIREDLSISNNDFVIITGGKIDRGKNTHLLIEAVRNIANKNIILVIFGTFDNEMKSIIKPKLVYPNIKYIGWIEADKVYDYFLASDLGVFPGTHSVLWEQAVGTGLPCLFKRWDGMTHVDLGGNSIFIDKICVETITEEIKEIYYNREKYEDMKEKANKGIKVFSYSEISRRSIGL